MAAKKGAAFARSARGGRAGTGKPKFGRPAKKAGGRGKAAKGGKGGG